MRSTKPDLAKLPGGWEPEKHLTPTLDSPSKTSVSHAVEEVSHEDGVAFVVKNALTLDDCHKLIALMEKSPNFESVSVQGRKDVPDYRTGSIRTSIWSPETAISIWTKIAAHLPVIRKMEPDTSTDWWQGNKNRVFWQPIGMTPLLRFMRYKKDGQHYAHYDAGFIYPNDVYRTLQSVVVYLTSCQKDGTTRFIQDNQQHLPIWDRNHQDWIREVKKEEVIAGVQPQAGDVLIFDHRLCHDVEKYTGDTPRIIIRADVLYRAQN